jgi:dolichol-phosphate mannosyltransferase
MLFGVTGLLAMIWVVVVWMNGGTIEGWASLAVLILITGSVQLLVLGVFGEYLGRMYMEAKRRPLFIVSEIYRQALCADRRDDPVALKEHKLQEAYRAAS